MIFAGLLNGVYGMVYGLIGALPTGHSLPTIFLTATTYLGGFLGGVNTFFPVDTLFIVIGMILTLKLSIFAFRILMMVMGIIRGTLLIR